MPDADYPAALPGVPPPDAPQVNMTDIAKSLTVPLGNSDANTNVPYTGGYAQNPNYKLIITHHGKNERVTAYLPEQFNFRIQNDWEPFLASGAGALVGNVLDVVNSGLNIAGRSINIKALSALIWKRAEPLQFSFNLQFDSRVSAEKDVKEPTERLIRFASPSRAGSSGVSSLLLNAPGPTIGNPNNRISLCVGRFFLIDSVVIPSVEITYYTSAEENGDFTAADAEVSFLSWYTPDADDIMKYFSIDAKQTSIFGMPMFYSPSQQAQQGIDYAKNAVSNLILNPGAGLEKVGRTY
jgi:hypothetical protein